jgi:hypothetical protein
LKKKILRKLNNTKEAVYIDDISGWYKISIGEAAELLEELVDEGKARRV